ncbi:MAG TPA: hypothetical protein DCQ83_05240 [Fibrobacteres bacterium]|nr:hypothetical protein [Fibrobacterota bacterium]
MIPPHQLEITPQDSFAEPQSPDCCRQKKGRRENTNTKQFVHLVKFLLIRVRGVESKYPTVVGIATFVDSPKHRTAVNGNGNKNLMSRNFTRNLLKIS